MSGPFKAFLIEEDARRRVSSRMGSLEMAALDAGEALIRVCHSSINFKDALAATGRGRIIRRFPCVGGIGLSGVVVECSDPRFSPGDPVLATSFDIGVSFHGGYADYAGMPADWVLTLARKAAECDQLKELRATDVKLRSSIDFADKRPMDAARWACAEGSVGGRGLAAGDLHHATDRRRGQYRQCRRSGTQHHGLALGPAGDEPAERRFRLRGRAPAHRGLGPSLAGNLRPRHPAEVTRVIAFDDLPDALDAYIAGQ